MFSRNLNRYYILDITRRKETLKGQAETEETVENKEFNSR